MTAIVISISAFIAFIMVNQIGALALEVMLLATMHGSAYIGLYYKMGCHIITILLAFPAFLLINRASISKVKSLFLLDKKLPYSTLAGVALLLLALTAATLLTIRAIVPNAQISPPDILGGIWLVLITPVIEEIIFRGVMLQCLKKNGMVISILMTSVLFAIGHMDVANMLISFLPGVVLAFVAFWTGSIGYTVPLHMLVNLCGGVVLPAVLAGA